MTEPINPRLTIDGQEIDSLIKNISWKAAKEQVRKSSESFNPAVCQISGIMSTNKEWEELKEELRKIDDAEFQKHKIKKEDFFKDISKAPEWLEDEFEIYEIIENENMEYGKYVLFPHEIYHKCQSDISCYGNFLWNGKIEGKFKRVLMIRGKQ